MQSNSAGSLPRGLGLLIVFALLEYGTARQAGPATAQLETFRGVMDPAVDPVAVLLAALTLAVQVFTAYLALVLLLRMAVAVPGRVGRLAERGGRLVAMPVLRRMVDAVLGGVLLANVAFTSGPAPAAANRAPAVVVPPAPLAAAVAEAPPAEWGARTTAPPPGGLSSGAVSPADPAQHVVQPGDALWRIAERFLGDPHRWPEIFRVNKGRPLPVPPGGRFTDPDLIYPGQPLRLPADASGLPTAQPRRGHLDQSPPGHERRTPADSSRVSGSAADRRAGGRPERGQPRGIPAGRPAPAMPPAATRPQPPARPAPAAAGAAEPVGDPTVTRGPLVSPVVSASLTVGGVFAFGVLAAIGLLRRRRQHDRQPGRRTRLPVGAAAHTEQRLQAAAEPEAAGFLDVALRAMAAGIHRAGLTPPAVAAIRLGPATLEVLLREPSPTAPPPFTSIDGGHRWVLPRDLPAERLEIIAADAVAPLPALVTVGMNHAGEHLLNLEAPGLTALAGPPATVRPLLDAMAVELATAASSGFVQVLLVGFGQELDCLERVRLVERLEDALPGLERQAQDAVQLLDERGCASVLDGRVADVAADSWAPTVVLVAQPPAPAALDRLAAVTRTVRGSTIAAVVAGDASQTDWRLEVAEEHLLIPTLDLEVRPQRLTRAEYAAIGELLRTASDADGVQAGTPPDDQVQPSAGSAEVTEGGQLPTVEVGVLGQVELRGVPAIRRAKAVELIVYLALHPQGVDGDQLWEALWPEKPLNRGTLHTTVTAARTGLGYALDGSRCLPDARDGSYRLSTAVGLDWARFQALARRGQDAGPEAMQALHEALELVRGTPLALPAARSYEWAVVHRTEMETVIAETAERLGLRCVEAGDPEQANWAARRGLAASPFDERLYRVLMLAAHAAGSPSGVDSVWQELLKVLDADLDLVDEDLHPETVNLYTRLRGSRRLRSPWPRPRRLPVPLNQGGS